ncbi:MAG: SDR family oxidoreductase [Alphaproteobacteria bacterium]
MKILLTGANGFIGRYLLASLLGAGHHVVPAVRRPAESDRLLPAPASIAVDFNRDVRPEDWLQHLAGIEAVINCAGILQAGIGQSIEAIHVKAPQALFAACAMAGVTRVIQISAISAEAAAGTAYAATKRAADEFLAASNLDWIVLRPSLVYAAGAYGGTALLRALAALPFAIPLPGKGDQLFQPIHVDDLSAVVRHLIETPAVRRMVIDPVGPERITLRQILLDLRHWLGFPPVPVIAVPLGLAAVAARVGDLLGGPLNTTALRQLAFGNAGPPGPFAAACGPAPRRWKEALLAAPAQAQDRWHARLYFVRPLLRFSLAALWLLSGAVGLGSLGLAATPLLASLGLSGAVAAAAAWASCLLDILIAAALLAHVRPATLAALQLVVIAAYTAMLSVAAPALWLDPFGPLLKNLPIVAAVLALAAIEGER